MVQSFHPLRLAGMRDWDEEACLRRQSAIEALQQVLWAYGYAWIDTPFLERTDLFLRKSGAELVTRLYSFTEPGGQVVALRPEFTTAVIRRFLEMRHSLPLPVRWHYVGPVFRHDPTPGALRQFTQVGAELIGASGPRADGELLALAQECLCALKGEGFVLTVGHMGCLQGLLSPFALSPRAQALLLGGVSLLRSGEQGLQHLMERAHTLGLFQGASLPTALEAITTTLNGGAHPTPEGEEGITPHFGGRSREEILARLARKLRSLDEPPRFQRAVHFLADLARLRGEPSTVVKEAYALVRQWGLDPSPLGEVESLLETLALHRPTGIPLVLDLALVRDIAYYTGVVFEGVHAPTGQVIAGGGRYDGLVSALGRGEDVPALGFALSLERLMEVSPPPPMRRTPKRVLVVPAEAEAYADAVRTAEALRFAGQAAEVAFGPLPPGEMERWTQQGKGVVLVHKGGSREHIWP